MYDINELENQWRRYARKRLIKRAGWGVAVVLAVLLPTLYVTLRPEPTSAPKKPKNPAENHQIRKKAPAHPAVVRKEEPLKPVVAPPPPVEEKPKKPKMLITLSDRNGAKSVSAGESEAEKKIRLQVTDARNSRVVKEIEKRFPSTRDYEDAMYLAKYYYGKKNYRKAEYWAMQANAIDSSQEESWIVFGKAKAKQGRRADALRVLQAYYDRSGSARVQNLIYRIRTGKKY